MVWSSGSLTDVKYLTKYSRLSFADQPFDVAQSAHDYSCVTLLVCMQKVCQQGHDLVEKIMALHDQKFRLLAHIYTGCWHARPGAYMLVQ